MRLQISIALLVSAATLSTTAFAQATLETLMTHSTSSAVSTHAGSALGNAINRATGNTAHQTATTTGRVMTVPQNAPAPRRAAAARARATNAGTLASPTSAPVSSSGSMIASIQGGEVRATATPKVCDQKTAGHSGVPNCAVVAPQTPNHPSVVNLPAPK